MSKSGPYVERRERLLDYVPGVGAVRSYERAWLSKDVVAEFDLSLLKDEFAFPYVLQYEQYKLTGDIGYLDEADPDSARVAPTSPSRDPVRRIDTILVGDASRVVSCAVAPPWGSDHRAVIARFAEGEVSFPEAATSARP